MKVEKLSKKELAALNGGGAYICSCLNEDGTSTTLPYDVNDAYECAMACVRYWNSSGLPNE